MTIRKSTGIRKLKPTFRSAYNLGNENYSIAATDGITEQHHSESCDINKILAQFMQTGIMPPTNPDPQYGDLTDSSLQFNEAMNQIAQAKSLFEELPDQVRERFDNEPYKFLQFAQDENNHDAMIEMGLLNAPHPEDKALQGNDAVPPKEETASDKPDSGASETVAT